MKLVKILQSQGYGSRRECEITIRRKFVKVNDVVENNPKAEVNHLEAKVAVDGEIIEYYDRLVIALNKPAGYECSHKPQANKSLFDLFTDKMLNRKVEPAGRLDADTTGLLLLSDDGKLLHQLSSPKKKILKLYRVTVKHKIVDEFIELLKTGVVLRDDPTPVIADVVEKIDDTTVDLGITSGKYHQVKRMVAAAHNRVEGLHRLQIGELTLESLNIPEGEFEFLDEETIQGLLK